MMPAVNVTLSPVATTSITEMSTEAMDGTRCDRPGDQRLVAYHEATDLDTTLRRKLYLEGGILMENMACDSLGKDVTWELEALKLVAPAPPPPRQQR